jgi:hypothetical protein
VIVVGIDPGLSGAAAILGLPGGPQVFAMPLRPGGPAGRDEIDAAALQSLARLDRADRVVLEEVGGDPRFGGSRAFNFGKGFGQVIGLVESLGLLGRLVRATPHRWKKAVLGGKPPWSKEMAVAYVRSLYPDLDLTVPTPAGRKRVLSHDKAEAVCLALYGANLP